MGKVKKTIQKVIPKEIKPYLPALAAVLGPAAFAGSGMFASAALASLPVGVQAALASAATSGLTQDKVDLKQAALSGIMSQAGASLKGYGNAGSNIPLESATPKTFLQKAATATGEYLQPSSVNKLFTNEAMTTGEIGSALYSGAKAALPVGGGAAASQYADMNEEALRKYNEELLAKGVQDKTLRRKGIYDIYAGIEDEDTGRVYSDEYINSMLDKYSYAGGGRVGFARGGGTGTYDEFYNPKKKSIAPKEGIESIQIDAEVDEDNGREKMSIEDIIKALKGEDSSIKDGLKYATEGLSMLNESNVKPTPMMRLGFEKGGFTKKEGILSVTDSNEGGMGGVMYYDENGKPISKEKAMKLFEKQAEEENKVKEIENKAKGGRIGYEGGGTANLGMELYLLAKDKFESMGYSPTEAHEKALEMSGIPSYLDERTSTKKANGGIIGLMNGGQPVEMDYRMGGMIPIGSKERADDVPARLSKNEFVMTADAVRAAGGGSVNEGAKRMYELMNNLEAKV